MTILVVEVVAVEIDSKTLKEAVNDAMGDWDANLPTTHFLVGSIITPVYCSRLERGEIKAHMREATGECRHAAVAYVGAGTGPSTSSSRIHQCTSLGVEAGSDGAHG